MTSIGDDWEEVPSNTTNTPAIKRSPQEARQFYKKVHDHAEKVLSTHNLSHMFLTDVNYKDIWQAYCDNLPAEYQCATCRAFIKCVGNVVLIDDSGKLIPIFWPTNVSGLFEKASSKIHELFQTAGVTSEYKAYTKDVGVVETGGYSHLHYTFPLKRLSQRDLRGVTSLNTNDAVSMLERVLSDYSSESVKKAHQILLQHKLPRADNHVGAATWLLDIVSNDRLLKAEGVVRRDLMYRYAATAFTGCLSQLRTGPLSILLGHLEANTPFNEIERTWTALTCPERYMRPTVAPTQGNVEASERLFNELGLTANDMRRRFLCADEVPTNVYLWRRKDKARPDLKIFGSVITSTKPQTAPSTDLPATSVSFTKLLTQILPAATRVWVKVPAYHTINFLITGLEDTKPLMQWHNDTNRASSYIYTKPYHVSAHGLLANDWNEVRGLISSPWLWEVHSQISQFPIPSDDQLRAQISHVHTKPGLRYVFLLDNVVDKATGSMCLFPEWLRGDLHGVRSTIEQYSNQGWKEVLEDIMERGGYVGGVGYGRGEKELVVRTEGRSEGVWKVTCFE